MIEAPIGRWFSILRVALGVIIGIDGVVNFGHGLGAPQDLQLIAFGAAELIGAVFLVWSRSMPIGACVLFCTFLIAAAVHAVAGDFPSEHLVSAVAVLFVWLQGRRWSSVDAGAAA